MNMELTQNWISKWVERCFGSQALDPRVRAMRLLEEAAEFAQAVGVPAEKCTEIVGYVFSRPAGEPSQELGGVGVTWLACADSLGLSAETILLFEMNRISKKTPEHFRARDDAKRRAGLGVEAL